MARDFQWTIITQKNIFYVALAVNHYYCIASTCLPNTFAEKPWVDGNIKAVARWLWRGLFVLWKLPAVPQPRGNGGKGERECIENNERGKRFKSLGTEQRKLEAII